MVYTNFSFTPLWRKMIVCSIHRQNHLLGSLLVLITLGTDSCSGKQKIVLIGSELLTDYLSSEHKPDVLSTTNHCKFHSFPSNVLLRCYCIWYIHATNSMTQVPIGSSIRYWGNFSMFLYNWPQCCNETCIFQCVGHPLDSAICQFPF